MYNDSTKNMKRVNQMEKYIVTTVPPNVSIDAVLSELHMEKMDRGSARVKSVLAILEEALSVAKPIALYSPFKPEISDDAVTINGIKIEEPFVKKMLSGNDIVVPYVASCGVEVDEWSKKYTEVFEQFIVDAIKEMFLDSVRDELKREVKEKYFAADKVISAINPGSLNDWPITGQKPLFNMLGGVTDDIGVILKSSLLMIPTKSVSGILFQTDEAYHNCQLCPRLDCPGRSAPYKGD